MCLSWQNNVKSYELTPREILEKADDGSKKNSLMTFWISLNFEVPKIKATLLCYVTLCYNWLYCLYTVYICNVASLQVLEQGFVCKYGNVCQVMNL